MVEHVDSGQRVTRVPHQCAYCALTIPGGTETAWWTWAEGGRISTSYGHCECRDADRWDAQQWGRDSAEDLMDPDEFRSEVLPEYRRVVAAAQLVCAPPADTPRDGDQGHGGDQ